MADVRKKFSLFNDQPHSYAVKKLQRLSAIGSDPLTNISLTRYTLTPLSTKMAKMFRSRCLTNGDLKVLATSR